MAFLYQIKKICKQPKIKILLKIVNILDFLITRCGCGFPEKSTKNPEIVFHEQDAIENYLALKLNNEPIPKWDFKKHTLQDKITDAYGDVRFVEHKYSLAKVILSDNYRIYLNNKRK